MLAVSSMLVGFVIGINWEKNSEGKNQLNHYKDYNKTPVKNTKKTTEPAKKSAKKSESNVIQFKKNV